MASVGVSKLGSTEMIFVEPGAETNGQYYRDVLLSKLLPAMRRISGNMFVFQWDSAPAHRARETIVHDRGSQFMSEVMRETSRLLSIKNLVSTPYHPQCSGLVERFSGTLKATLKKLCAERPKDWDRYLESVLFIIARCRRKVPGFHLLNYCRPTVGQSVDR